MGKHILVVDDEAVVLGAVAKALKKLNCTIDSVQSAEEALKRLKAAPYDLVIADLIDAGLGRARADAAPARTGLLGGGYYDHGLPDGPNGNEGKTTGRIRICDETLHTTGVGQRCGAGSAKQREPGGGSWAFGARTTNGQPLFHSGTLMGQDGAGWNRAHRDGEGFCCDRWRTHRGQASEEGRYGATRQGMRDPSRYGHRGTQPALSLERQGNRDK